MLGFDPLGLDALAGQLSLLPPVRAGMRTNRHHAGPINRSMWRPNQLRRFVEARQLEVLPDFWIVDAEVVQTARVKLDRLQLRVPKAQLLIAINSLTHIQPAPRHCDKLNSCDYPR